MYMSREKIEKVIMPGESGAIALQHNINLRDQAGANRGDWRGRLIERVRAREAGAFDDLMLHYQRKVYGVACKVLGNVEDAKDATQETFLRVFKYFRSYDSKEDFDGWLYRIVVNVCMDLARKRHGPPTMLSYESEQESIGTRSGLGSDDVEAAAILAEEQSLVERALATLPTRERAAIVLRDIEQLSTQEVARILGSTQSTVRAQISSARTKIKAYCDRLQMRRRG